MGVEFPPQPVNIPAAMRTLLSGHVNVFVLAAALLAGHMAPVHGQTISSITNNTGGLNGLAWIGLAGDRVTIWGNTFSTVSAVRFNGVLSPLFGTTTPNTITAYIPNGAAGSTGLVSVTFSGGPTINSPQNFIVPPTGPYVRSFDPIAGNTGTLVTINGTRFTGVTSVSFNGITGTGLQKLSDTLIKVAAPPGVTTGPLTVFSNSFAHVTTSNFFVPPTITSFSPASGRAGTNVTVTGQNLTGVTQVQFGALNATSITPLSATQLVAVVPNAAVNGKITVFAPAGSFVTTSNFVVLPTLSGFTPNVGTVGTDVTLTGANLNEGSGPLGAPSVFFNGVPSLLVTNVTFNQLTARVPNGASTGKISVTTTNGSGTNDSLFYLPPRITNFTPATNPPGTRITITGTNFTGATAVTFFLGVPSLNFTVTNDNLIGAEVPAGISTGPISVTAPAGTGTSLSNYFARPVVTSFSQASGLPGTQIRVSGTNFQGATAVRFTAPGGTTNAPLLTQTSTFIDVFVPTNAITGPVSVVAPGGIGTSSSDFVLLYPTLQVTASDSPDPVNMGSTLTYTIQVMNFGPGTADNVIMTNILPASVSFVSASGGSTVGGTTIASLGSLGQGGSASLTITGIPNNAGVTITNTTTARAGLNPVAASATTVTTVTNFPVPLSITVNPSALIELSWPLAASNYTLQFRTNLSAGAAWANEPTPPATNGNSLTVTLPNTGATRFYRLKP